MLASRVGHFKGILLGMRKILIPVLIKFSNCFNIQANKQAIDQEPIKVRWWISFTTLSLLMLFFFLFAFLTLEIQFSRIAIFNNVTAVSLSVIVDLNIQLMSQLFANPWIIVSSLMRARQNCLIWIPQFSYFLNFPKFFIMFIKFLINFSSNFPTFHEFLKIFLNL